MRPPRIAILVFFIAASLFVLCRALSSAARASASHYPARPQSRASVWGYMYYNTPFSLFPPNAAISLTDDNSTSFAARPAAFGPKLAHGGLSGQLWVGSGFAEDALGGDGELGCSDLPGWDGGSTGGGVKSPFKAGPRIPISVAASGQPGREVRTSVTPKSARTSLNDGTDDHLNQGAREASTYAHADIQSIQEAAEIDGKVVLLKRGGCGFLEKVMWAQRRGAIAVVVGDNEKGGPLIQMFAHGQEVENVTIPSVFTASTTAHLLSSLTQPGSFVEDTLDDNGNPVLKVQQGVKSKKKDSKKRVAVADSDDRGWVSRVFNWREPSPRADENSRTPPIESDWVVVETWKGKGEGEGSLVENVSNKDLEDSSTFDEDYVIGVQGWRGAGKSNKKGKKSAKAASKKTSKADAPDSKGKGRKTYDGATSGSAGGKGHSLMSKIFGDDDEESFHGTVDYKKGDNSKTTPQPDEGREGLWVTITPTSSASPFFDTLLVLVISPLITLTVVYALLILRARIRRRRWRAPKSVVERLPVRTYHTVVRSPSLSPRLPSPSSASPTTPLLQQQQSQSPPRSRPRSRTTTGVENESLLSPSSAVPTPRVGSRNGPRNEHEKGAGGFSAEWKKYMGRQVECVVCLEEYVDGESRVMSLPCGHEFHADCM